ncbi:MAG: PIG-L family deacetylase, partial [Chloroflexi bacterium]|nr:PIG-L family deacetylase [Chloroflexota bacterium]
MSEKEFLPKIAMSIHAHPDDQEFTVAGTLARWVQAGCRVISVVVTSGDAGNNDPARGASYKPTLAELREAEQSAANGLLGIHKTV